ncbi:MAG: glycosyltransferase [Gammaproteobacteria bacterium]|nr:glycosyltransferase [Gammaproteobacteria bacterium]
MIAAPHARLPLFADALTGWRATVVALFIALFPLAALLVDSGATGSLLVVGILGIAFTLQDGRPVNLTRDEKLLVFSVVFFFAVAVLAWALGEISYLGFKKVGRLARFLLFVPIFLAVRRVPGREFLWWFGLAFGAIGAAVYALWQAGADEIVRVAGPSDPIAFGALALVMGFMSLGGITHFRQHHPVLVVLPATAVVAGCVASFLSGTLTTWLALPALLFLVFLLFARGPGRLRWWLLGGIVLLVSLLYGLSVAGRDLVATTGVGSLAALQAGPVGFDERFVMWQVAWASFLENPLLGAGVGGYIQNVREWYEAGRIDAFFLDYNHPHNEYLSVLASRGLVGLVALFLLFIVPLKHFLWAWRHRDAEIVALSFAGIALIVGYMHFALVEAVFDRSLQITFYVFSLSVIYGLIRARERVYLATEVPREQSLSVIIIAKNEADRIGDTLAAVKGWADEIIVLDSGSTDGTVAIARKYADIVKETDWPGFGRQKQRALELATKDWVLSLDADEVPTKALKNEIDHELRERPDFEGYRIARPMIIFGRQVDYGGSWQAPLRLFRRELGRYTDVPVHERVELSSGRISLMRSPLLHPTWRDYGHAIEKFVEYARLQSGARWERGKRSGAFTAGARALYNFFYNYIARFGFLDGRHGFVLACLHAQYTFNKYAALWASEAQEGNRNEE